jgi:CheY-like chemotaxis protein
LEALRTEQHIDLLITDIQMPGMGALNSWSELGTRPPLKVIAASGRADAHIGVPLLRKPFGLDDRVHMAL